MGIVRYKLDPKNPPKLSEEDRLRFDAIRDEDIDYSDIPELDAEFWKDAVPLDQLLAQMAAQKKSVTIRYDAEVIDWFKANASKDGKRGRGYQTAMNAVLKAYVKAQKG